MLKLTLNPVIEGTVLESIGANIISLFVVFALLYWVGMSRLIRGQILSLREQEYVLSAKATGAEAIFVVAYYADSASIVMKIRDLEYEGDVILTSTCLKQAFTETAGDAANGCYLINAYCADIDTDEFRAVKELYESTYNVAMDAFVMQTWDVVNQIAKACEDAGSFEHDAIRDALDGMTYKALGGEYTMNEIGDAIRGLFRLQIRDGKFVNVTGEF